MFRSLGVQKLRRNIFYCGRLKSILQPEAYNTANKFCAANMLCVSITIVSERVRVYPQQPFNPTPVRA